MKLNAKSYALVACLLLSACSADEHGGSLDLASSELALQGENGISASSRISLVYIGGYCARVTVSNGNTAATSSWTTALNLGSERITRSSNVTLSGSSGAVIATPAGNAAINPGGSTSYGFCATGTYRAPAPLTAVSATFSPTGSGGASSGGAGSGGASSGGASAGGASGPTPVLPTISGACPRFATGTVTVGGLGGISLQVGPRREGTGSLLFYWHGTGSTASEVNRLMPASVRQEILDEGGIIVSFQSSLRTGGDCSGTSTFSKDDFNIADIIAACAVRDHGIDPRRIYTTGCSAGGLQAGCMGALRSSYIAATVPNSGGLVFRQAIQDPSHVPAVMTMHGGPADFVGVSFAQTSATYDAQMDAAGSFVVNCNHGGGHCQAPSALYGAAWDFMKAHPFGVSPNPFSSGLPGAFPSYCRIY